MQRHLVDVIRQKEGRDVLEKRQEHGELRNKLSSLL